MRTLYKFIGSTYAAVIAPCVVMAVLPTGKVRELAKNPIVQEYQIAESELRHSPPTAKDNLETQIEELAPKVQEYLRAKDDLFNEQQDALLPALLLGAPFIFLAVRYARR